MASELILPPVSEDNICLPLSINAVASYWSVNLSMSEAAEIAKKYPGMNGSILIEGIELAERNGLASAVSHSTLAGLKEAVDAGIPPIVILPGVHNTIQHASVISGYDAKGGTIMHYIPQQAGDGDEFQVGVIPEGQFDRLWSEDGHLMILLGPADTLSKVHTQDVRSNRLCFEAERLNLLKKAAEAVSLLKEAIKLDSANSTAHSLLGSVYNVQGSSECITYYKKSIEINPRSYLAYRGLGNYYIKKRQYEDAAANYTRALEINPTRYGPLYKNRAVALMETGKKADAAADLAKYLEHTPGAPDEKAVKQAISELGAERGI